MSNKFAVGDRVAQSMIKEDSYYGRSKVKPVCYDPDGEGPDYGVITDVLSTGEVMINWDSSWKNSRGVKTYDPDHLMLEQDMVEHYQTLEEQFNKVEGEISSKIEEACKLINEAGALAETTGRDLHDMYETVRPLVRAMDSAGWNTSSWGC